jgi:NitT/TauT family transport system ATP-binding protein
MAQPPLHPVIELQDVGKNFPNGTIALAGMSVAIGAEAFVSFLGPSGCGKSTALRLIAGLATPSSGQVRLNTGNDPDPAAHEIGFVFQEPTLMPWTSVRRNVYLPLKLKGIGFAQARPRIDEALARVGLVEFAEAYPRELSGGMKMRVSIARALVTRPRVLLMDEPFAALDEMTRSRLNDDVLELWRANRWTIVFVTHSVYESVYLSNRIVVMGARPGRVIDEIDIDAPYPRGESFRLSQAYNEYCRRVSRSLQGAAG